MLKVGRETSRQAEVCRIGTGRREYGPFVGP